MAKGKGGHGGGGSSSGHAAANGSLAVPHRKSYKQGAGRHGHPRGPAAPHPNLLPRRR